jgi:hypothetical protein
MVGDERWDNKTPLSLITSCFSPLDARREKSFTLGDGQTANLWSSWHN